MQNCVRDAYISASKKSCVVELTRAAELQPWPLNSQQRPIFAFCEAEGTPAGHCCCRTEQCCLPLDLSIFTVYLAACIFMDETERSDQQWTAILRAVALSQE